MTDCDPIVDKTEKSASNTSLVSPRKTHIAVRQGVSKMEIGFSYDGRLKIAGTNDTVLLRMSIADQNSDANATAFMEFSPGELENMYDKIGEILEGVDQTD